LSSGPISTEFMRHRLLCAPPTYMVGIDRLNIRRAGIAAATKGRQ
tara:strand:- start:280 stop:414 length:135 start_codon:yes stop_codon:yes gene_type:complete